MITALRRMNNHRPRFLILALGALHPLAPLVSNLGTDYGGKDRTTHLFIPYKRLEAWRDGRKSLGLSANDVLRAAIGPCASASGCTTCSRGATGC